MLGLQAGEGMHALPLALQAMVPAAAWRAGCQPARHQAFPILNTGEPHLEQVPRVAGLPFFSVMGWAF